MRRISSWVMASIRLEVARSTSSRLNWSSVENWFSRMFLMRPVLDGSEEADASSDAGSDAEARELNEDARSGPCFWRCCCCCCWCRLEVFIGGYP